MSTIFRRINSVIAIAAAATLAGKEGYFYKLDGDGKAVIIDSAADIPHGLIGSVRSDGMEISAVVLGISATGTVPIKLGGNVTDLRKDLTLKADGSVEADDSAGARVVVARPVELGSTDEFIECVLLFPRKLGAAVVLGSTNGAAAAAADLAALKAETEVLGDDVRSMHAALATAGFFA